MRRFLGIAAVVVTVLGVSSVMSPLTSPAAADASTGAGGEFVPVQGRILDTRANQGIGGYSTPMPANVWRTVQVAGQAGLPTTGVAAVAVNFTVMNDASDGYLKADMDESTPNSTVSYMFWSAGQTQSNSGVVAVANDGKIQIKATSATDLIVDVQGYYTTGPTAAGGFVPVSESRIVDTRNGTGLPQAQLASGTTSTVQVAGLAGVPSDASAVMANFLVENQSAGGNLTAFPADESRPLQSLNFGNDGPDSTTAAIGLSSSGALDVHVAVNGSGSTDLVIDVLGYFSASEAAGAFTPAAARVYDSRTAGNSPLAGSATTTVQVSGVSGVPVSGISAVTVNVIIFDASGTSGGWTHVWPDDAAEPNPSMAVQYYGGDNASNLMTVALGADGGVDLHNLGSDTVDFAVDVEGWYTATGLEGLSRTALPTPATVYDSSVNGTIASSSAVTMSVAGLSGMPSVIDQNVEAIDVQATVAACPTGGEVQVARGDATSGYDFGVPCGSTPVTVNHATFIANDGTFTARNQTTAAVSVKIVVTAYWTGEPFDQGPEPTSDDGTDPGPTVDPEPEAEDTQATDFTGQPSYSGVGVTADNTNDVPTGTDEAAATTTEEAQPFPYQFDNSDIVPLTDADLAQEDSDASAALAAQGITQPTAADDAGSTLTTETASDSELSSSSPEWSNGVAAVPKGCAKQSKDGPWYVSRFHSCYFRRFSITAPLVDEKAYIDEYIEQLTDPYTLTEVTRVSVRAHDDPDGFPFSSVRLAANWETVENRPGGNDPHFCAPVSPCSNTYTSPQTILDIPARDAPPAGWVHISYRYTTSYTPQLDQTVTSIDLTKLHMWIPQSPVCDNYCPDFGPNPNKLPYDKVWRRIDNSSRLHGIGAVLDHAIPVFVGLDTGDAQVAKSAAFVDDAQKAINGSNGYGNAIHPGRPGSGNTPLRRIWGNDPATGRNEIRRNRYWACKGFQTRTPNKDSKDPHYDTCDEYPFATTRNGAYRFRRSDHLSERMHMPRYANVNAGTRLGAFLQANRILSGDAYWVRVLHSGPCPRAVYAC